MKALAALILLGLLCVGSVFAEGGSSGVGSAMPIANGVFCALPTGFVQVKDGFIKDGDVPILSLSELSTDEIGQLPVKWVPARLGSVRGFEYLPSPESQEMNSWVICTQSRDHCTKLTPLSKTNRKVPAVIGSLIRPE